MAFFGFFGIGLGQHSKLETGFLGSVGFFWFFGFLGFFGFFWYLNLGLEYHPKKYQKKTKRNQKTKKTKKTQKNQKTSRYTKIGKLAWFFLVFFGVSTPQLVLNCSVTVPGLLRASLIYIAWGPQALLLKRREEGNVEGSRAAR